jgi:putative tryptophan/tyrosine transport system substrate-binding protein
MTNPGVPSGTDSGRRALLRGIGATLIAGALPARAQPAPPRVCWLSPSRASEGSPFLEELRAGLRDLGYAEGRNIVIEPYWGEDSAPRVEKMIAEVIASKPALIVSQGGVGPLLSRLNSTPVVFGYSGDPVAAGMVQSLSRPGGHMTGISYMALELVGKRIELLREVLPSARRVACVSSPQHPGDDSERRASQEAASKLGIGLEYFALSGSSGLDAVLPAVEKARVQAAVMFPTQNVINASGRIAAWSVKARVPMISGWAQFADRGNFMSYGPNLRTTSWRL